MYKVNYLIPTANNKNILHSYIARTLAEATHVKAKCKDAKEFDSLHPQNTKAISQ
jgi:hypothetical protein